MRAARQAMAGFRRTPLLGGLSIGAIGFSLVILGLFGLAAHNLGGAIGDVERRVEVVGYLLDDASQEQIGAARREMASHPAVSEVYHVTKDEALANARRDLVEFSSLYQDLHVNPLPASLHLRLREGFRSPESVAEVAGELGAYPFIEEARFGGEWVEQLFALRQIATGAALALGGMFALVAVLLIVTSMRLAIRAHREEIRIMQIVGASEAYIQRPFLYEGAMTGLVGGLVALGLTRLAYAVLRDRFASFDSILWLPESWIVAGVLAASALGLLAALFSVHRELAQTYVV